MAFLKKRFAHNGCNPWIVLGQKNIQGGSSPHSGPEALIQLSADWTCQYEF
jgi:hypothetical protein